MTLRPNLLLCLLLAVAMLDCGCLERANAPLPVSRDVAEQAGRWEEAGSFGGTAKLAVDSADPWEQRFEPGGFLKVSGLGVTTDEVWVTDLDVSRIQVFDYSGHFLRSYGLGMPVRTTLPSDRVLFEDEENRHGTDPRWEDKPEAQRWIADQRNLFSAADVLPETDGFWIADWARTAATSSSARRGTGLLFIPFDQAKPVRRIKSVETGWPAYLAEQGNTLAISEPLRNAVFICVPGAPQETHTMGPTVTPYNLMQVMFTAADSPQLGQLLYRGSQASGDPAKFYSPGGVALAFNKLLVCDSGNARIQIFEARNADPFYWGQLERIVEEFDVQHTRRFEDPQDIAVASSGRMYILDGKRQEVAEFSPTFERLGVVGKGFGSGFAVALSPDDKHLFVSDRGENIVHRYVRTD